MEAAKTLMIDNTTFANHLRDTEDVTVDLKWLLAEFNINVTFGPGGVDNLYGVDTTMLADGYGLMCDDLLTMLLYSGLFKVHPTYQRPLATFTALLGRYLQKLFHQHNCNIIPLQGLGWYKNQRNWEGEVTVKPDRVMIIKMIRMLASAKEWAQQTATILLCLQKRRNTLFRLIGRDVTEIISRNVKYSYWTKLCEELRADYREGYKLYLKTCQEKIC
jgi:hypothetical protein